VPETAPGIPLIIVGPPATLPACATATPATCEKNTTGASFIVTPTNPAITISSSTVGAPVTGTAVLTVISYGGWNGILNFTCSNLPADTTCNPFPGVPTVAASTPSAPNTGTQVQFTITTNVQPNRPTASGFIWWLSGLLGLGLLVARKRLRNRSLAGLGTMLSLVLMLVATIGGATGCSSGFAVDTAKTPAGTTNVLVTVSAAQLIANSNPATYMLPDSSVGTFTVALTVK
jgi:hypothetical protein